MRVITWNVNSVGSRLERLLALLARHKPDVLCLQELKCEDGQFRSNPCGVGAMTRPCSGRRPTTGSLCFSVRRRLARLRRCSCGASGTGVTTRPRDSSAPRQTACTFILRMFRTARPSGRTSIILAGAAAPFPRPGACFDRQDHRCRRLQRRPVGSGCSRSSSLAGKDPVLDERARGSAPCAGLRPPRRVSRAASARNTVHVVGLPDAGLPEKSRAAHRSLARERPLMPLLKECAVDRDERKGDKPSDHAPVLLDFLLDS